MNRIIDLKIITTILIFFSFLSTSKANTEELFCYDEQEVNSNLAFITSIEVEYENNPTQALKDYGNYVTSIYMANGQELPLGTAFWWGFASGCLSTVGCWSSSLALAILSTAIVGPAGILAVYLITDDKDQAQEATIGCLVGYASGVVISIVTVLLFYGAALNTYYGI